MAHRGDGDVGFPVTVEVFQISDTGADLLIGAS